MGEVCNCYDSSVSHSSGCWLGLLCERVTQGLKAIHSVGFVYGLKPVPTSPHLPLRGRVRVKRQYPFRRKAVPHGLKPSSLAGTFCYLLARSVPPLTARLKSCPDTEPSSLLGPQRHG